MMNGYSNPYNNNNNNNKLSHQLDRDVLQQTDYRPYNMINKTSSTKHNVSNVNQTVNEMYDMNNGDISNPSNRNANSSNNTGSNVLSNDDLMSMSSRHPPNLHNSQMQMMMNQQRNAAEDVYNFEDEPLHPMSPHPHMGGMGGSSYGSSMRNNLSSAMMGGYSGMSSMNGHSSMSMKNSLLPSMHSPMDTRESPSVSDIAPKKRGRKKKVREEFE